ncbi:MAG TPA: PD-(D/E)XK nuclease family protein [Kiritimatiellia bacterium]|mgnify:CR=1 FL=1|nr:PD-(D/E)XK nuclease family protein [Kiritimatiellia bacterium]
MSSTKSHIVKQSELQRFFSDIDSQMRLKETRLGFRLRGRTTGQKELEQFFAAVTSRVRAEEKKQRRIDKRLATGFNVFDLIEPDENKLSDILATLLDPNGDHGQGGLFLQLLLERLGLDTDPRLTRHATVQREAPTYGILKHRRRMDVLVEAGAMLAIENKVDSSEQADQVKDYLEHLSRCAQGHHKRSILIYLTPHGRSPDSLSREEFDEAESVGRLRCWSYQVELREWLEACREGCAAQKIQGFLTDFITYIESKLKREPEIADQGDANED